MPYPPLLQDSDVLLFLVIKLRLEESEVITELIILRPVILCFLSQRNREGYFEIFYTFQVFFITCRKDKVISFS